MLWFLLEFRRRALAGSAARLIIWVFVIFSYTKKTCNSFVFAHTDLGRIHTKNLWSGLNKLWIAQSFAFFFFPS